MSEKDNILEAKKSAPTNDYDAGYQAAIEELKKALKGGGGPGGDGPINPVFPDPRLVLPMSSQNSSSNSSQAGQSPKNKTIDVETGEEKTPKQRQKEGQQQTAKEEAEKSAKQAQDAASKAQDAASKAQATSDAMNPSSDSENGEEGDNSDSSSQQNGGQSQVNQKIADKAKKAAEKAQKAADKAQKAAQKAQDAAAKGNTAEAAKAAEEAKEAADEAEIAANEMQNMKDTEKMTSEQAAADAAKNAKAAREAADIARKNADNFSNSSEEGSDDSAEGNNKIKKMMENAAQEAEKAAQEAEKAAQEAQNIAERAQTDGISTRDLQKAQEAAQKARESAQRAESAKNSTERISELDQHSENNDQWSSGQMSSKDKSDNPEDAVGDLFDCSEVAKKAVEKYSQKLTGPIGAFLDKCKDSIKDIKRIKSEKRRTAVKVYTKKAKNAWDVDFKKIIDTYVSDCVDEAKHERKKTYMRPNRRQGVVRSNDIIKKGELPKKNKMDITMTFYIDISGSMYGAPVKNAFKAAYAYSDFIRKQNQNESVVGDFDYTFYAFNTRFKKITGKQIPEADGGNVDFNEILEYIESHSLNDMINIIITDAQFGINPNKCIEVIKRVNGLFIVIANNAGNASDFEKIKNALKDKFEFLEADSDFTFKEP